MKKINSQSDCRNELKKSSLRATPARIAIIKLLKKMTKPVDINTIHTYLNKNKLKVDLATVFRIMNILTMKKIATVIHFEDRKARYELTGRAHHHHLVCEKCGSIEAVCLDEKKLIKQVKNQSNFKSARHNLEFFGTCVKCQ